MSLVPNLRPVIPGINEDLLTDTSQIKIIRLVLTPSNYKTRNKQDTKAKSSTIQNVTVKKLLKAQDV